MGILDNLFNFTAASGGGQNPSTPSPAEAPSSVIDLVRQAARQQAETATKDNLAPAATVPLADDRGRGRTSYARQTALERKGGGELAKLISPLSQLDETQQAADRKAAAEENYNAAQRAYDEARADFTRMTAAGIATPNDFSDAQNRVNEAKTTLDDAKKAYEGAGGNDPSFLDRLLGTVKGGLKGSLASTTDAQRALYEAGQTGRSRANQEDIDYWTRAVEQNQRIYDKTLAMHGGDVNNGDVEAARNLLEDAQRKLSAYQTVEAAQPGASAAAAELADVIQQSSAKDLARAKENGSGLEKFLVDAGASGIQMLGDAAVGSATGVGMLPAMALRSFGGGTQEARQAGANIREQLGYGAANAAVEVITEKMADGLAGLAGKGAADDVAEEVIRRLASTDEGRTALRALYGMGGEAVEEVVSSVVNPAIKAIYDKGEAAKESYGTGEGRKQLLVDTAYDALVGAALGGVGTATSLVNGQNAEANRELTIKDAGTTAEGQLLNALNVAEGRISLEDQLVREQAARQRLSTGNPVLDVIQTGAVQNAAETAAEAPAAPAPEITPATMPTAETAPAAVLNTEATPEARQAEIQTRLNEINNLLDTETDADAINQLYEEADSLYQESQALDRQIKARDLQQSRIDSGAVSKGFGTDENHIDNRTSAGMADRSVKAFQFDHPELHEHFVNAAQELMTEVEYADGYTKAHAYERGTILPPGPVQTLMEQGLTKPRIMQCLQDIIADNGQENYADAKRVEKVLSDMMTNGWRDIKRADHSANADYIAAKDAIDGGVKANSWEAFLERSALSLATGEVTEEQLRAEWEAQQRSSAFSQQNIDNAAITPYNNIESEVAADGGMGSSENLGDGVRGGAAGLGAAVEGRAPAVGDPSLVSDVLIGSELKSAFEQSGVVDYGLKDSSNDRAAFSAALNAAREANPNGWAVTPQNENDLVGKRLYTTPDGLAGFAVTESGDIEAVFKHPNSPQRGVLRILLPQAIENGGTKLDCYGPRLAQQYSQYGFVPVARVTFDPTEANPGWDPSKGTPDVIFMMHNGDSAADVVRNKSNYHIPSDAEIDALPLMSYGEAMEYRDKLLADRKSAAQPTSIDGPSAPPPGGGTGPTLTPTDTTTAESTNGSGNERERGGSANIRTNENAEADLRQSFENAPEMYRQMTNAEVQAKADAIMARGFDAARSEVEQAIGQAKAGMKLKPEYLVAGFEVANEMTRRGDVDAANRLMADLFAEQTAGGQLGQLGRLLRAQAPATKAQVVQNLVDKMNNALNKAQLRKNMRRGVGDAEGRISVDSALVEQFANATDEAASDAALDAIQRNIANQIPATISEKFTALRYLNMLGNLKTQGRNIVGNTAMMATTDIKRTVQAVNELVASAVSGGKYERNTSLFTSKELRQQAAADFEANINEIKGESKYSEASKKALQGVQDYRTIFGSGENAFTLNIGGKDIEVKKNILENARRLTNWAMDAGDVIFMRHTYIQAFAGWMKAHGVSDVSSATQEQVQKARAFAAKEAQEATFHDNNAVSDWVSGIGRGENAPGWVNTPVEGIMPFRKTPANVAVRAIEYSPVGVAETIYKGVQAAKGKATAADVINSASKSATGTALAVAGYFLAAAGIARGSGDDEDDELNTFQKMQGASDYSVKIGDSYVSLSQFAPMSIPFFMGVKLQELIENSDEPLSLDSAGDILGIISDPMLEMSMLSGVNDTLSNVASLSGDTDAIPSLVANAAIGYLSQVLTNSLLGQAEQAWEKNRQTSYTDTKSADATEFDKILWKGQYKLGQIAAKTPGVDYHQQDYVDAWGRTRDNGNAGERLFNAFLNPTYVTDDSSTDVDAELERLHRDNRDVEDFPEVLPKKRARSATIGDGIVMTPDEYLQFSKDSGQMKLSLVRDFMGSQQYKSMSDAERAKTISDLYAFADDRSLQKVKGSYGVNTPSDWDDEAQLSNVPEYLAAKSVFTNKTPDYGRIDNLISDWDKLSSDTQDKLSTLTGMNGVRFSLDELGIGSKQYNQIKADITKYEKDGLDGETKAAADAAVIAKHFKGTDEEKIKALESQNLPDKKTGKRASIVRRFEAASEQGISFEQWSQIEAYVQDHAKSSGSPSNTVLNEAAKAVGLKTWQPKWIWRTYSADEKVVDVYNDYFSKDYVAPERVNYGEYLSSEEPQTERRSTGEEASMFLTESELAKLLGITS